ncbi:MAG: hypothetical protein IJJ26_10605 [Victivallales bacterium]|nr:hypothetical protein [Victivallales bacterium]
MNSTLDIKQARELVRDKRLWPLVNRFLFAFAPLVDDERVAASAGPTTAALRGCARVDAFVLKQLNVEPIFHTFPASDGSRLLLLNDSVYLEIGLWLAALADAKTLRRTISKAKVQELKVQLPNVYPEVLRLYPYFHKWKLPICGEAYDIAGLRLLATALKHLPAALMERQKLRFPKRLEDGFTPLEETLDWELVKRLLQLHFPEEYAICCL